MKILVADNDPIHLRTMKDFLRGRGYAVVVAKNVPAARQALQDGRVDLAILDVRLSEDTDAKDISGLTLAKTLAPQIPKIVLTRFPTYANVRDALRTVRGGRPAAIGFVSKPEGLPAIERAVDGAVKRAMRTVDNKKFFGHLQSGDRAAWKRLWDAEAWRLIMLVRRHGLDNDEAKDICVQVFRNVAQAERPPRTLTLKTALVDETLRQIDAVESRKGGRRRRVAARSAGKSVASEVLREDIVAPAVKLKVPQERLIEQLQQAIRSLKPREQTSIVMHLFEGASVADIARSLGVTQKTVNKYLESASALLKDKLEELERA